MAESAGLFSALSSLGGDYMGGSNGLYWFAQQKRADPSSFGGRDTNQQTKQMNATSSADYSRNHYRRLLPLLPSVASDVLMFILDNPFVGVVGIGSLVAIVKKNFWWLHSQLNKQLSTSLELNSDDACYEWLLNWLHAKEWGTRSHVRGVLLRQKHGPDCNCDKCESEDGWGESGDSQPSFALVPNLTSYGFEFEGRWITIGNKKKEEEARSAQAGGLDSNSSLLSKKLTLSTTGCDPAVFSRILTEAYPERLDPALIRPGRVDVKKRVGYCTEYQIRIIFKRFFVDASESVLEEFLNHLRNREGGFPEVTPASLQGFFLLNRYSALGVLSNFEELFRADERLRGEACMQKKHFNDANSDSDTEEKPKKKQRNYSNMRKAVKRSAAEQTRNVLPKRRKNYA